MYASFEECNICHAYNRYPEHICPSNEDSIRISGDWTVENIYRKPNTNKVTLLLNQREENIEYTTFSDILNEFYEGEVLSVLGWKRVENKDTALVVKKK